MVVLQLMQHMHHPVVLEGVVAMEVDNPGRVQQDKAMPEAAVTVTAVVVAVVQALLEQTHRVIMVVLVVLV